MKTLSIGGATYDLFVRLPKDTKGACDNTESFALPLGAKIRVKDMVETCGGGANNTSVGLSRLGCNAYYEGVISSDQWGEKILKNLQAEGVNTDCITIVEDEVSSFSIILTGDGGERVILYEPGTNAHLHDVTFDRDLIEEMDWVYLNHIQEDSCVIQDDIIEKLCGTSTGLTWNPGGCQLNAGLDAENNAQLLGCTSLILLNKEEACRFTNTQSTLDALQSLLGAGAKYVVITDGKNGTTASDGTMLYECGILQAEVVDTTGAGDAFGTGVTWGLLQGMTLKESLKTGSIQAASVVSAFGAQTALLTDTEINIRRKECDLTVFESSL